MTRWTSHAGAVTAEAADAGDVSWPEPELAADRTRRTTGPEGLPRSG